jgi:hypothetical protein
LRLSWESSPESFFILKSNERKTTMENVIIMFENTPQHHLTSQGIRSIRDLQTHLQEIFENSDHQSSVIIKLYRILFPDWDNIERIEGFPIVGKALWIYICNLFIEFDRLHHPDNLKGGSWINYGFSSTDKLDPWEISLENCKIIYS